MWRRVMAKSYKVIVTNQHKGLKNSHVTTLSGAPIEWKEVPVLAYEKLPAPEGLITQMEKTPFDWIIFTSPRSVHFFSEWMLEAGIDFPIETQVACIGEETSEAAALDGHNADFFPTEPGTEKFLEEFSDLVSNNTVKPRILLPAALHGRTALKEGLEKMGCAVELVPLYRTYAREDIANQITKEELEESEAILFTSPSSFDAFTSAITLPKTARLFAIGQYTNSHLQKKGVSSEMVPEGDMKRLGELI
jgi:uroporphyrinogen III methyltransferase / synthase